MKLLKDNCTSDLQHGELLQHDNAPCHTARRVGRFITACGVGVLQNWPSQSPDLNISKEVWRQLKISVQRKHPKYMKELWALAQEEFARIHTKFIQPYMPPCLNASKKFPFCSRQ